MFRSILASAVVVVLLVGCSEAPSGKDAGETKTTGNQSPGVPPSKGTSGQQSSPENALDGVAKSDSQDPPVPVAAARTSLVGRWILILNQQGNDFPVALLDVSPEKDGSLRAGLLESGDALPDPKLVSSRVKETQADLTFGVQGRTMNFQGTLGKNGTVKGTVLFEGGRCDPALLIATESRTLAKRQPAPSEGRDALMTVFQSDDSLKALKEFVSQHSGSPLAMTAYEQLFALAKQQDLSASEVENQAADYIRLAEQWGPRMQQMARINVGLRLAAAEHLPDVAAKYFDEAEKQLNDETAEHWKPLIEEGRRLTAEARLNAQIASTISQVKQGSPEEQKQAVETLHKLQKQAPFHPRLIYALAEYAQQQKQIDEAVGYYAQLVALPMLERLLVQDWLANDERHPLPNRTLAELWKQQHGGPEGLEAYLNQAYEKSIYRFADEPAKPRSDGTANRVVLCELFTGSQCPPCVSADVATGGVQKTYDRSQVIVLRYHEHIPGEDPLANEDSEARFFNYYNGRGTPTLVLNGKQVDGPGGFLQQVSELYDRLRQEIDPLLAEKSPIAIMPKAHAEDGVLSISAEVSGLSEPSDDLRLRLALAEDDLEYVAPNGIRRHEMVVRAMPGGPAGIAPENGQFQFTESIKLADFRQRLFDYLTAYEQGNGVKFSVKPLKLDKLHLVAFLQNDSTHEVLQTVVVPVTGTLEYPALPVSPVSAPKPGPRNPFEGR